MMMATTDAQWRVLAERTVRGSRDRLHSVADDGPTIVPLYQRVDTSRLQPRQPGRRLTSAGPYTDLGFDPIDVFARAAHVSAPGETEALLDMSQRAG